MSQKRYTGEAKRLYDFMKEFSVYCPKCNVKADVSVANNFDYKNAVLKCSACHFSENAKDRIRYKSTDKAKCSQCLTNLRSEVEDIKTIPNYITIICPECRSTNKVKENWESYILKYHRTGIVDPAFGLPLWYQTPLKDEIIWAYNLDHLNEIRDYVSSELRERTTDKFKMTMVEKLPEFIKIGKNREEVLKALRRMVEK